MNDTTLQEPVKSSENSENSDLQTQTQTKRSQYKQYRSIELTRLESILEQDGFVIFIRGAKGNGKTDFALWLAEICYEKNYHPHVATNIWTESYIVEKQITNIPDLKVWLSKSGRKLFILDEAGKHIKRMSFAGKKNQAIMDLVQMIRHYDAGLIVMAPAARFIDKGLIDPDVIDAEVVKIRKTTIQVFDSLGKRSYFEYNIPRTSIKFKSKDIAEFTLEKRTDPSTEPRHVRVAKMYAAHGSYHQIEILEKISHGQVRQEIQKYILEQSLKS